MICEAFDIVAVPFPFLERPAIKRRPALVISAKHFNERNHHCILAMITTAKLEVWPDDYAFLDPHAAGLVADCFVRMKIFTLANSSIVKKLGRPTQADQHRLSDLLGQIIPRINAPSI